jgi:hypothetical protein
MMFNSCLGLRSCGVAGYAAVLGSVFSVGCGGAGSTPDAEAVETETTQLQRLSMRWNAGRVAEIAAEPAPQGWFAERRVPRHGKAL